MISKKNCGCYIPNIKACGFRQVFFVFPSYKRVCFTSHKKQRSYGDAPRLNVSSARDQTRDHYNTAAPLNEHMYMLKWHAKIISSLNKTFFFWCLRMLLPVFDAERKGLTFNNYFSIVYEGK